MTTTIRPSDGAQQPGPHIDLNVHRLKAGDRVLFEPEFGRPRIDTIDLVEANVMVIDGVRLCVTAAKARLRKPRPPEWEAALLAALEASFAAAPHAYKDARRGIIRGAWRK